MQFVRERHQAPAVDYKTLHSWSVEYPEKFWGSIWDFFAVVARTEGNSTLEDGNKLPGARWFPEARFNYAENLLRRDDAAPAIIFRNERGVRRELSHRELRGEVARVAAGLRTLGVVAGDRVAAYLPNIPEATIAMLATASIGAIWSSCSTDFGASAVLDRFGQITPKVLFAADGYSYAGKPIECIANVRAVAEKIASIAHIIVVPYLHEHPDSRAIPNAIHFKSLGTPNEALSFEQLPFDHPLLILYSSGTSGAPKCIVHGAGGALLQQLKEHALHADMSADDRFFFYTTTGWVMWNALVSGLALGATIVMYDGSPLAPSPRILWRIAQEERVTIFGTSPRFLTTCEQAGVKPGSEFELSALRTVISTGAPLMPYSYHYVYRDVKSDVLLASIAGGTDIIACFGTGCPTLPVIEGEMQCLSLGMKVEVFDAAGQSLVGAQGELVCTAPFPSVPLGFWGDLGAKRFHAAYFARFPNVWWHGDLATITASGGLIIHGRADTVLNPGGVRIGTAEIYRQVEKVAEVAESIAISQAWNGDVRIVLFVRLCDGLSMSEPLQQKIAATIREHTTPRHVPAKIIAVPDLPRTINGKLTELTVRNVVHGLPVKNIDALANPDSLAYFKDLPELRS